MFVILQFLPGKFTGGSKIILIVAFPSVHACMSKLIDLTDGDLTPPAMHAIGANGDDTQPDGEMEVRFIYNAVQS